MKMINKNIFLQGQTCLTKGWYLRSSDIQVQLTQAEQFRIKEGITIGAMARSLYEDEGILVNEGSNTKNYQKTKQLIQDENVKVIFEATFLFKDYVARADILGRINGDWHLIEVKSNSASENVKDELIDDLTYTATILSLCGIKLKEMSLLLVSKNYQLGMDNKDFFTEINCTEEVNKRRFNFIGKVDEIAYGTDTPTKPKPKLIYSCKDCDYYKEYCLGKNIDDPIFDLPRLGEKKFKLYTEENILLVSQIQLEDELSAPQKIVWTTVRDKKPFINKEKLKELLGKIIFPIYYLDFESVSTAIPLYNGIRPYQEIVTQYSIHKFSALNINEEHFEFLSDYTKDDRKNLAKKLLIDIGKEGSVIVYHAQAEKRFINNLVKAVPELANELNKIIDRIVDLEVIIKEGYYHPSFHGSYSIKVVLPALAPDMSYKNLAIGDGESASAIFAELARRKYSHTEAAVLCKELLKYCKHDTLAMVKIHEAIIALI